MPIAVHCLALSGAGLTGSLRRSPRWAAYQRPTHSSSAMPTSGNATRGKSPTRPAPAPIADRSVVTPGSHLRIPNMETVAGATTIGHTLAYSQAVEALAGTPVSARAHAIRASSP